MHREKVRVAIIGGGISGLSTAYYLNKALGDSISIQLFEASSLLGGKLQTSKVGEFLVEHGPDSVFTNKPWAYTLFEELGFADECIDPSASGFSIQREGKLYPVPIGILKPYPENLRALLMCGLISPIGKIIAAGKILRAKFFQDTTGESHDRSLQSFLREKWGKEVAEYLFEPLYAGVHAGEADKLSVKALYPHLLKSEETSGVKGTKHGFVAPSLGMGQFIDRLKSRLGSTEVFLGSKVTSIEGHSDDGYLLRMERSTVHTDVVVLALPAYLIEPILGCMSPSTTELLSRIKHADSAIVSLGISHCDCSVLPLGSGFIVPARESGAISGCTVSSSKWEGRAPAGGALFRVFFRTAPNGQSLTYASDEQLIGEARSCISKHLGELPDETFHRVDRWMNGVPQYTMGHLELLKQIDESLVSLPGMFLTGVSFGGIGIPDCVRQGEEAAHKVSSFLQSRDMFAARHYPNQQRGVLHEHTIRT